jgi:hypothetical protein
MNGHEGDDVRPETIDAGADIEVLLRTNGIDLSGSPKFLFLATMSTDTLCLIRVIKQRGH